eukprot:TRINITY_DN19572_c0_g1_i2.p1 TRINITY_DN19572_c0_g1~~TRINITY_DN19572_c0_g1_i2.p1  ORF type:complete len:585 (-),score=38.97 TRINITY_DN19572_c0_g1_i2:70-1824(-)
MELQEGERGIHGVVLLVLIGCVWTIAAFLTDYRGLGTAVKSRLKHMFESDCSDRVAHWRWTFIVQFNLDGLCAMGLISISIFLKQLTAPTDRWWTAAQDYVFVMGFALVVTFHFFAESLRQRLQGRDLTHAYYLLCMVLSGLFVACSASEGLYAADVAVTPVRLALSMIPLKKRYLIMGHLVFDVMAYWRFHLAQQEAGGIFFEGFISVHATVTVAFLAASRTVEQVLLAESQANARTSVMYAAARRLLDLLCDSVLELGLDLHLITDAPSFAAMLFLNNRNSLAGAKMTSFMSESDSGELLKILIGVGAGHGPDVGALNAVFRDSAGNSLQLELFYIFITSTETETRYLIGLREHTNVEPRQLRTLSQLSASSGAAGWVDYDALPDISDISDTGTSSSDPSAGPMQLLAVPGLIPTAMEVKRTMVGDLLRQFCFRKQRKSHRFGNCCERHSALKDLLRVVVFLQHEPCDASFAYHCAWQCKACGVLHQHGSPEDGCSLCAARAQGSIAPEEGLAERGDSDSRRGGWPSSPSSSHSSSSPKSLSSGWSGQVCVFWCWEKKCQFARSGWWEAGSREETCLWRLIS